MEIFLDTADLDEIERWLDCGVLDGVTTNPSIMLKDGGYDLQRRALEIARLVEPRPVSVEVTANEPDEMVRQARIYAGWAANIVVKIPVINEHGQPCLGVVRRLERQGIRVNLTACLSYGQAVLGDWRYPFRYLEGIRKVTPEDIQRVAKAYFTDKNRTVAWLEREK